MKTPACANGRRGRSGLKGDRRAVEPLIEALKDGNAGVREQAAWALGLRGDQRAMKALRDATKDQNREVRERAAWALGLLLMHSGYGDGFDNKVNDTQPAQNPNVAARSNATSRSRQY